MRKFTLQSRRH